MGDVYNYRFVEDGTDFHRYKEYEIADSFFEVRGCASSGVSVDATVSVAFEHDIRSLRTTRVCLRNRRV